MVVQRSGLQYLELARSDPKRALDVLDDTLAHWSGHDGATDRSITLRGAAIALRLMGDLDGSDARLDQADREAEEAGDELSVLEARVTRSGNLALRGDTDGALELLESLDTGGHRNIEVQVKVQSGMILARSGRASNALEKLTEAVEAAEAGDDPFLAAAALQNRGMLRVQAGLYEQAEADLIDARARYDRAGLELETVFCDHNLGLLAAYLGDLPLSFERFEAAESRLLALTGNDFEPKASHCRALIAAGLCREAATVATEAAEQCIERGQMTDGTESLLMAANAWLEAGADDIGEATARRAADLFEVQGRPGWRAAAELTVAAAALRRNDLPPIERLDELVASLTGADLPREAILARLLGIEALALGGRSDEALGRLATVEADVGGQSVDLRLAAETTAARCLEEAGRVDEALARALAAYRMVGEEQAVLAAADLRVGVRRHADRLADQGLALALDRGDAVELFQWLELVNVTTSLPQPVRPEPDPDLRHALARLRSLPPQTSAERTTLEKTIRTRARTQRQTGHAPATPSELEWLAEELGPRIAVTYGIIDGSVVAVVLRDGIATVERLADADDIHRLGRSLRAALRKRTSTLTGGTGARLDALLGRLSDQIVRPLELSGRAVVLVAPASLVALPWTALHDRAGQPYSMATSLTAWAKAGQRATGKGHRLIVAGPDLDHARAEVEALRDVGAASMALVGAAARTRDVVGALDGASVAHIVAHGTVRTDNPLFSSLRMADGELSVYELADLERAPEIVILSACHVGLPADAPGQELLGMVTGFLNAGTSCVIASTLPVPDDRSTIEIMTRLHRFLAQGMSPAVAWAEVQRTCPDEEQLLDTASFTVFGRG